MHVLRRKARWREEWMRDRALLRDLLQKTPHASPRELAQATGRGVELGQKMAQAAAGRRCPRSRALVLSFASAPCALLPASTRASNPASWKCVCLRKTHLGRTPGPRALLSYLPRDPVLQAAGVRLPRSSRTVWKLLRKTGCILPKPQRNLQPDSASGAVGGDPDGCAKM